MENEQKVGEKCEYKHKGCKGGAGIGCGAYGLGFVGALVYFIQHAETFWMGALGLVKALVWPAILVYKLLTFLK